MKGKIFARIIAALLLLAAIAGIAFFAFNAGVAQGVATKLPQSAQPGNMPYFHYGAPFFWHPFFGIFGFLIGLFLLFFVLRMISFIFWGPRWDWDGHMGHRAWHQGGTEDGVPAMFKEWHDRAHGKQPKMTEPRDTWS
ncbi:MAG: hypothetical protein WCA79_20620 [Anaerolineales bacterium]